MNHIIEVKNISKKFRKKVIFEQVSLSVEKGNVIGIIGENGSGKSIFFKMLCGLEDFQSGEIIVDGKRIEKDVDFPENVGILINSPGYIENHTGYANLKILADIGGKIGKKEIIETMEFVGLNPDEQTKVKNYSVGMKQKLGIAQAIMENQDILILDEVFNGLDYKSHDEMKNILRNMALKGKTILLTSHDFSDISLMSNEIYIIDKHNILKLTDEMREKYFENKN